jgi:hypothetical protein
MDTYGTTFDAELMAASSKVAKRVFAQDRKNTKSPQVRRFD